MEVLLLLFVKGFHCFQICNNGSWSEGAVLLGCGFTSTGCPTASARGSGHDAPVCLSGASVPVTEPVPEAWSCVLLQPCFPIRWFGGRGAPASGAVGSLPPGLSPARESAKPRRVTALRSLPAVCDRQVSTAAGQHGQVWGPVSLVLPHSSSDGDFLVSLLLRSRRLTFWCSFYCGHNEFRNKSVFRMCVGYIYTQMY